MSLIDCLANLASDDGQHFYLSAAASITIDIHPAMPSTALPTDNNDDDTALEYTTPAHVLIIDQFEELFTTHADRWPERADFFRQLQEAQEHDPLLWVVLVMREDFVAELDPYANLLTDKLRIRYYMQRMGLTAAQQAIQQPARKHGRPFTDDALTALVDNLSRIRVMGQRDPLPGQYVEPVQLQVVCLQLWANLQSRPPGSITIDDLQEAGDVDRALADYYEQSLRQVQARLPGLVSESALRDWFSKRLITESGTRGLVNQGTNQTGGLPNAVVQLLNTERYLVRRESRAGGVWCELTHDRFVQPILDANRKWEARQNNPLTAVARLWLENGRDPARLLRGQQLRDAQAFAAAQDDLLRQEERDFLRVSVQSEGAEQAAVREAAIRRRNLVIMSIGVLLLFALLALWGFTSANEADRQKTTAEVQATEAAIAKSTAVAESTRSAIAVVTAETALNQAQRQSQLARSRQLAAQSLGELSNNHYETAILLAIESGRVADTLEAFAAIRAAIASPWHSRVLLQGHTDDVTNATWSHDDSKILTSSDDNTVRIWDAASGQELVRLEDHTANVTHATWSRDDSKILTSSDDNTVRIWDAASGQELLTLTGHTEDITQATWSHDDSKILTSSEDSTARIWDAASGQELLTLTGHTASVWQATWSRDDSKILTRSDDNTARIWDAGSGQELVTLAGHTSYVNRAMWSRDENKILTASEDGTARVWDAGSGQELVTLTGHTASVWQATWSRDDSKILTASEDGTARIWYAHMRDLIDAACQWAPRNMNESEWSLYMENPYRPTCPTVSLPLDVIVQIKKKSMHLITTGKIVSATQYLEELNTWLVESGQFTQFGVQPKEFVVQAWVEQANQLALRGEITASLAAISRAVQLDPNVGINGDTWNTICWNGALAGLAAQVITACEKAVAVDPKDGGIRNSRGLARALTGNTEGAITDFAFFIAWAKEIGDGRNIDWRERYMVELKAGKNPFTPAELQRLRDE